ncbi:MAG: sugar phosphate nucleotidyltransferase, partial [Bacteroidota bacterium]|nr:sugar phosphate nucleotidyltransferase [Bacteroidota bacterium]
IGSRYGSMKQVDHFGPSGETIIDYSVYDAIKAGFGKVVFIISANFEENFNNSFRKRFPKEINIDYAIQDLKDIPTGYTIPANRNKPWGTGHAVLAARSKVHEPFAVVNGDDFYGPASYGELFSFLFPLTDERHNEYCLVGYPLEKTLSKFGLVSRGICQLDANDYLKGIQERTKIGLSGKRIVWTDEGGSDQPLDPSTIVSMNMFGFTPSIFQYLEEYFERFMQDDSDNPGAEFFLPTVVNHIIEKGEVKVKVLRANSQWFGVTYKEDKPFVSGELARLAESGTYPKNLWG